MMNPQRPMPNRIDGQTFVGANIQIDSGVAYVKCKFVQCTLVFTGMGPIQFMETTIENCQWAFAGPAGNTLNSLRSMYVSGAQEMVEQVFRSIRGEIAVPVAPKNPGAIQ
jgi:hypothetical protein